MNPHDYGITVRRFEDDNGHPYFEARVRELPDVAEYAGSFQEAYELAIDTIETTAQIFAEQGRKMPPPAPAADEYSGRITVRTTRSLHRELSLLAEEENVSLNQLIVSVLGVYTGMKAMPLSLSKIVDWQTSQQTGVKKNETTGRHLRIVRDQSVNSDGHWSEAV